MKRPPIDPELLRDRLSEAQGKQYWRSLEELGDDPAFREMLQREFPQDAAVWEDVPSRRRFLTLMGASFALAGITSTGCRAPTGVIMPYVKQPENFVLGKPLYYATAMPLSGFATGVLVESHEGRPTKIEGNPQHPASNGATSSLHQAAILGLYDPDRSQTVQYRGQPRTYDSVIRVLRDRLTKKGAGGQGVAILSELIASPTLRQQRETFLNSYPAARWFFYEPINRDNVHSGAELALGRPFHSYFKVAKADVIVSLDADFLNQGPAHLTYTREFAARRRNGGEKGSMNRLYAFETNLTVTGAAADNRLAVKPSQIDTIARALAVKLKVEGAEAPKLDAEKDKRLIEWIDAIAEDLLKKDGKDRAPGTTLVVCGDGQPPAVHAVVHAINHKLKNFGKTVLFTEPMEESLYRCNRHLDQLLSAINDGEIHTLIILGGNPAFTTPANLSLGYLLSRQLEKQSTEDWLTIHLGQHFDETARLCHWHIPESHFLEQWSDANAFNGQVSIVQPLIAPLYGGKSAHEVIANLTPISPGDEYDERTPYEIVQAYWKTHRPSVGDARFDRYWKKSLHDGVMEGTTLPTVEPSIASGLFRKEEMKTPEGPGDGYELVFAPDPTVYDGRFANNGWLQEAPKPITCLTWDNALMMSPATAKALGVTMYDRKNPVGAWKGGEHGESLADIIRIKTSGGELEVPAWIVPGHADGALTLHLGYGRTHGGKIATGAGFNANVVRTTREGWFLTGLNNKDLTKLKSRSPVSLACVQAHHSMEGRTIVISGSVQEKKEEESLFNKRLHHARNPHHHAGQNGEEKKHDHKRVPLDTLYSNDFPYNGYKWGMAVDLSACVGCGACVVACQAENNIPVVGKEQVLRGREMHWIRIDRYYYTDTAEKTKEHPNEVDVYFQPVMCQHCENAPCELVCPVEATVHGDEGTNDMVYNRCVGTRYCANNCPYKVRRFNFLQYSDYTTATFKLMHNPDVTVRSRGVMEKCSFCIQRISYARIEASKEAMDELHLPEDKRKRRDRNGPDGKSRTDQGKEIPYIRDGEIVTACQSACPAEAIIFGDLNDKNSRVHKLVESQLSYDLLGELGVRPRVTYLAALNNPNPKLEGK